MKQHMFKSYELAQQAAQVMADKVAPHVSVGIAKGNEYGTTVYRIKYLPWDKNNRYGWELRCEEVHPTKWQRS